MSNDTPNESTHHTKHILTFIVCLLILGGGVAVAIKFYGNKLPATSQGGNLCGSTNGRGQIVSVGSNSFTVRRNDGTDQLVTLADQATIKTPAGAGSISFLKTGDRVTIVGQPNADGSETATAVLVCGAAQPQ